LCHGQNIQYVRNQTTIVGTGSVGYTGDGLAAAGATLNGPEGAAFDAAGNLYIADAKNNVVRRVDAVTNIITTIAGSGTAGTGCTDGTAAVSCAIGQPYGVAIDAVGNIYISDPNNNVIRRVNTAGNIYLFAGTGVQGKSGNGAAALSATLYFPTDLVIDAAGANLYFADSKNGEIRSINFASNILSLVAGTGIAGYTADGNPATQTELNVCYGMALDAAGDVFIADTKNYRIRVVYNGGAAVASMLAAEGISSPVLRNIYTVAGNGTAGTTPGTTLPAPNNGNGSVATNAMLVFPQRMMVDPAGNLLIADSNDNQIRRVDAVTGIMTAYAGVGVAGSYTVSAPATTAYTKLPLEIFGDAAGNIYYVESGYSVIRKLSTNTSFPSTVVGASSAAQSLNASLNVADTPLTLQIASGFPDFTLGTVTGCTLGSSNAIGVVCTAPVTFTPQLPGLRTAPVITTDAAGQYVTGVSGIGKGALAGILPGTITTIAGGATSGSTGDGGAASSALLGTPQGTITDSAGNLYVADTANNKIRFVSSATGKISTIAGTGVAGASGDGAAATAALLSTPHAVAVDAAGNVYIADTGNNKIRMVSAQTGFISTIAGTGFAGASGDGSLASVAQLSAPSGVAVDAAANVYIADTGNNRIRKITAQSGVISTLAGNGTAGYSGDGAAATAAGLNAPAGVWADLSGIIYVADSQNNVVRAISPSTGFISTVAGTGSLGYAGDGAAATAAKLDTPSGVVTDAAGNLYIADTGNNTIRVVAAGIITTAAGTGSSGFGGDAGASNIATLQTPGGVAVNGIGRIYIADTGNNRLRQVDVTASTVTFSPQIVQTTSAKKTVSIVNQGNTTLTLTSLTIAGPFASDVSSTCIANATLAPGANCVLALTFTPLLATSNTGTVTVTNSGAGAAKTIALSGTGLPQQTNGPQTITFATLPNVPYGTSPITLTASSNSGLPVSYSVSGPATLSGSVLTLTGVGSVSVTASQSGNANFTAATPVTQTFTVTKGALTIKPSNLSISYGTAIPTLTYTVSGLAATDTLTTAMTGSPVLTTTATSTSTAGIYPITATAGTATATNYTLVFVAGTLTINKAVSTTVLTVASTTVYTNQTFTVTATVSGAGAGLATGTVTFTSGAITLGTGTVASGVATASVSNLAVGIYTILATYSGDGNVLSSASTSVTITSEVPPDFALVSGSSQLTIPDGQNGLVTLTLTPTSNYAGTLRLTCSTLPMNVECAFSPGLVVMNGSSSPVVSQLVISTVGHSTGSIVPRSNGKPLARTLLFAGILSLGLLYRARKHRGNWSGLIVVLLLAGSLALSGCGVRGSYATTGNINVNVSATDTATGYSHSVSISVMVD
jgi:sugar lactone lactonase YvrE